MTYRSNIARQVHSQSCLLLESQTIMPKQESKDQGLSLVGTVLWAKCFTFKKISGH